MNDQVLELICKLANKLHEYEYETANRGDSTRSWPAEVAAKFLLDHTIDSEIQALHIQLHAQSASTDTCLDR